MRLIFVEKKIKTMIDPRLDLKGANASKLRISNLLKKIYRDPDNQIYRDPDNQ